MRALRGGLVALGTLVALSCSRSSVEAKKVAADPSDEAVRKLFQDVANCGDWYKCPPLEELEKRVEKPGEVQVLRVAMQVLKDPKVLGREGKAAGHILV